MCTNDLIIQLNPSYRSAAESIGYNLEPEEMNNEAVLYQQGIDTDEIGIEPGEKFKITSEYESGSVSCEEINYKLIKKDFNGIIETIENEKYLFLEPGKYLFHPDGITIEKLSDIFEDE